MPKIHIEPCTKEEMNIKIELAREMGYNLHYQGFVNGLDGKSIIYNLKKAIKIRVEHENKGVLVNGS